MENNNFIQKELMESCPSIVQIDKKNLYSVPPNYFDQLDINILEKIRSGAEPSYFFSRHSTYKVPEGYFETLGEAILQRVSPKTEQSVSEELESISPFLNKISKKPLYTVPKGYFDKEVAIPEITAVKSPAKVIRGKSFAKMYSYAAAAVFIGLVAIGFFLFGGKDNTDSESTKQVTAEVKKLSNDDIADFLKNTYAADNVALDNEDGSGKVDITRSVKEMSDREIRQYLKDMGELDEM